MRGIAIASAVILFGNIAFGADVTDCASTTEVIGLMFGVFLVVWLATCQVWLLQKLREPLVKD